MTDSLFVAQTPGLPQNNDLQGGINVGLTFTVAVIRSCSGGRFYGPTTITGTVDMSLYEVTAVDTPGPGAGTLLAAAVSPAWSASQWNNVTWPASVVLLPGHTYRIVGHNSQGDYAATVGTFSAAGLTNGDITSPKTGVGGINNGCFVYGMPAYPTGGGGANFFVDILLAPTTTVVLAATGPAPSFAAAATAHTSTVGVSSGGWYQILDIGREASQMMRDEQNRRPVACPNDGEPLENGPDGTMHCRYDGWQYPRDWVRPGH